MHSFIGSVARLTNAIAGFALYSAVMFHPIRAAAQMPMPSTPAAQGQTQPDAPAQGQDMQAQITKLKQQVAQLQVALQQSRGKSTPAAKGTMSPEKPAMGMGDDSGEMGGTSSGSAKAPMAPMGDDADDMAAMPAPGGSMKGGAAKPMGCCGMSMGKPMAQSKGMAADKMGGMSGGGMASQKGKSMAGAKSAEAPHLLHIGATDFFLDHAQHIGLTSDQRMSLETIKSKAMQQRATSQKAIDVAQQELWQLTSADQPDTAQIDSTVAEIAKAKGDQQTAFIHSVSEASNVLNPQEKEVLVKSMTSGSSPKMKKAAPMKDMM